MKNKVQPSMILIIISAMLISACEQLQGKSAQLASGEAVPDGVALIKGEFEYSNDFVVETYYVEHAVGLLDMTGFVITR